MVNGTGRMAPLAVMRINEDINAELADAVWVLRRCCCPVSGGWHRDLNQSDLQLPAHRALLWGTRDCSVRYNSHLINHWLKNSLSNLSLNLRSVWGDLQDETAGPYSPVFPPRAAKADDNYGELVSLNTSILTCLSAGLEDILLINSKCSSKKATTLQTVKVPRSNGK